MKLFSKGKDGGPYSTVTGYWLVEWKRLFSVALLRFDDGSRDAYHSHALDSLSWVLRGRLIEQHLNGPSLVHERDGLPIVTMRETFHKVLSVGTTWALTFRGPWSKTWNVSAPRTGKHVTLAGGRAEVGGAE